MASGTYTQDQIIKSDAFTCPLFESGSQTLVTAKSRVTEIKASSYVCEVDEIGTSLSFFDTGFSILANSNYNVLRALPNLRWSNIKQNIGFFFAASYWGVLVLFELLALFFGGGCKTTNQKVKLLHK